MNKKLEITDEQKKKMYAFATHFWYIFVILGLLIFGVWSYQSAQSAKAEVKTLQLQKSFDEDIKATQARLDEIKKRELEYKSVIQIQGKLNKVLEDLDKSQKELEKLKKGAINEDVKKMDSTALSNSFNTMGFPVTVVK